MEKHEWSYVISSRTKWFDFHAQELWNYRNLITMFVKRNLSTMYKQTVLGPLWIIINPLISTLMFTIVFGKIADISTDGVPDYVFYMAGNILWSFFAASLQNVSSTFTSNAHLFGKVYFPRLTVPIANVLTQFVSFLLQFIIFAGILIYVIGKGAHVRPNFLIFMIPLLLLEAGVLSIGLGIFISALTAKYHDLNVLVGFGIQLWMYASPVVYPASVVSQRYRGIYMLNPMAPIIETLRCGVFGIGDFSWGYLGISLLETIVIFMIGMLAFNRVERTFLDTV